jgi:hypothetical protein
MTVNEDFRPNRKPLFKNASELQTQTQKEQTFEREPHQCPHLLGPTYTGSSINFCSLMSGIVCTKTIYNDPEQYRTCEYLKIYTRFIPIQEENL